MNYPPDHPILIVTLCLGSSCHSRGNRQLIESLLHWKETQNAPIEIQVKGSLCLGGCSNGPLAKIGESMVSIQDQETFFDHLERALQEEP